MSNEAPNTDRRPFGLQWRLWSFRVVVGLILFPAVLMGIVYGLFLFPAVQSWTATRVSAWASAKSGTEVRIDQVRLRLFRKFAFGDVYIEDFNGDTLLYTRELVTRIDRFNPLTKQVAVRHIRIRGAAFTMRRELGERTFSFSKFVNALGGKADGATLTLPDTTVIVPEPIVPESKKDVRPWQVSIGDIEFGDSRFYYTDHHSRTYMDIRIPQMLVLMRRTNPQSRILHASQIEFNDLEVLFWKPDSARGEVWTMPPDTPHLDLNGWVYSSDVLELNRCRFAYTDQRREPKGGFDPAHMDIRDITLKCNKVEFVTDTIRAQINQLGAKDQSGLELSSLSAGFILTNGMARLAGMDLRTPGSVLMDTFSMDYGSFRAFENFEQAVRMDGWFRDSRVAMEDIRYFAPGLEAVDGTITLEGHIYGSVDNLHGRDLDWRFGSGSVFEGRFDVNGLPDVAETFIEFKLNKLETTAADLRSVLPGVTLPNMLDPLGRVMATGEFIGFPGDFVAFGEMTTGIGVVRSDLNLKIDPGQEQVAYSGNLDLTGFDLGLWTGESDWLGPITAQSKIEGTGSSSAFGLANLDATMTTEVNAFSLRGYTYKDVRFDGHLQEGFLEGTLVSADPNFDQTFEGAIDLRKETPVFDFRSEVRNLDFYAVGLYPRPLKMQGILQLNLSGDHLDSVLGTGGVYQLALVDSARTYTLDSLLLQAMEEEGQRFLTLESDLFSAAFEGHFALTRLPDAIRQLINSYFPQANLAYDADLPGQDLRFALSIRDSREFLRLADPKLGNIREAFLSGSLNNGQASIDLRAKFPAFRYGTTRLDEWAIDIQSAENSLQLFTRAERIWVGDSIQSPVTVLESDYRDDSLFFRLMVGRDQDPDRLNLSGAVSAENRAFTIALFPSEIYAGGERWEISPNNSLRYDYRMLTVRDFTLHSGEQVVSLNSLNKPGYDSWLDLDLQRVRIGELLQTFQVNPMKLEGELSGRVSASNVFSNLGFAANLVMKEMEVADLPLGKLTLNTSMQYPERVLNFNLSILEQSDVRARGHIGLDDGKSVEADVHIERLPIQPLGIYLSGLFDELEGYIRGDVRLRGTYDRPDFSGSLGIDDGALRLIYLNNRFLFDHMSIDLKPGSLVIAPAELTDEEGNTGNIEGTVRYTRLDTWRFDPISIQTDFLRFMQTDRKSNPEFFGTAYGSGQVNISGPLNDIKITARARSGKGTSVVIPIDYGPSVSGGSFVTFRQPKTEEAQEAAQVRSSGRVRFEFYLDITEEAEATIELLGDDIRARGQGNLHMELSTLGDFSMDGIFTVSEGSYSFSLQELVSKDFRLEPGSTITWTGDPYQATLQVNAVYTTRTSEWDLVSTYSNSMSAQEIERAQQLQTVEVYLTLAGSLEAPDISFDIRVPGGQSGGTSVFERRLQQIKADENELNKQVFGLLVMNRFIPDESSASPFLSSAGNSVSEFVSKQLSVYVSDWVSDFLITDVDIDISYRNYQNTTDELTQQELQIELSKRFLDNRIYVNVGGNFGLNQTQDPTNITGTNNNVAGDFEIEYALTADGRFRIKAFQRPDYDVVSGRNIAETGIGLFYTQEFDTLYDLFADRRKRKALRQKEKTRTNDEPDS